VVFEVVAEHRGGEGVDGSARGRDRPDDLLAPALLAEGSLDGLDLPLDPADPRDQLLLVPDGVHRWKQYPMGYPPSSIATVLHLM
jgi:hypothetical protein